MKKYVLIVFACVFLVLFSTSACSAQGAYFSGNLGIAMMNDSGLSDSEFDGMGMSVDILSKSGIGAGVALGYDFGNSMRVEGEFAYQTNDMDKLAGSYMGYSESLDLMGDTTSTALMLNGYWDFTNLTAVTPFLSAGIGYSKVKAEITGISGDAGTDMQGSEDDTVLAYQLGAGIGLAVSQTLTIDGKYRYFATEDLDFEGTAVDFSSHNFYVGLRLSF